MKKKPTGLYANIQAKRDRIESGSGERMRKTGARGAPTAEAFRASARTAKKKAPGTHSMSDGSGMKDSAMTKNKMTSKSKGKIK